MVIIPKSTLYLFVWIPSWPTLFMYLNSMSCLKWEKKTQTRFVLCYLIMRDRVIYVVWMVRVAWSEW